MYVPKVDGNTCTQMQTDQDWVEDPPPTLRAKVLALKVCRNRCLAHAESETALEISQPVIRMFSTVLQYEGVFKAGAHENASTKSRLRLQAATSMLHLSAVPKYVLEVTKYFVQIALTIQVGLLSVLRAIAVGSSGLNAGSGVSSTDDLPGQAGRIALEGQAATAVQHRPVLVCSRPRSGREEQGASVCLVRSAGYAEG